MPQGITQDEANALRARLTEALKDEPNRSPKRTALRRAFGQSNFTAFMAGKRGASPAALARVTKQLEGGDVKRSKTGRARDYVSTHEAEKLRADVMKQIGTKYRSLGAFFLATMGVPSSSQSGYYTAVKGRRPMTRDVATKLRAALDGGTARALVVAKAPRARTAPLAFMGPIRLDAGHVLANQFGGNVPEMARELEVTAAHLSKVLAGGSLLVDDAANLSERLARLVRCETPAVVAGNMDSPVVRARRLVAKLGPEAIAICLQLALQEGMGT